MAIDFKGAHFPPEVILMGVRWYVAYPLSTRHVEELMEERGVEVDHSTINRWVIKYSPQRLCRKYCSGGHAGAVAPVWVRIKQPGSRTIRPQ
jgi:transposase-like protein